MYHLPSSAPSTKFHPKSKSLEPHITSYVDLPRSRNNTFDPSHSSSTRDITYFIATVLELIRLLQSALSIFGFFRADINGLLCDLTVQTIQKWVADIGEPCIGLEVRTFSSTHYPHSSPLHSPWSVSPTPSSSLHSSVSS